MSTDPSVYALKIELELDFSKFSSSSDELTQKLLDIEDAVKNVAKASLGAINENLQSLNDALGSISAKLKSDINPELKDTAKTLKEMAKEEEKIVKLQEQQEKNQKESNDNTDDLSDLFDDAGDGVAKIAEGWRYIRYFLESAIKGIEEFRTANYRLNGSMTELLVSARSIDSTIGDFGQSIQIIKTLNNIRAPSKDIEEFGVAIAKANVYTGVSVETLGNMTATMIKSRMSAEDSAKMMDDYADTMTKTGVTSEDLTAILNDQTLSLNNLAVMYSDLSKEGLETAQSFQKVAMRYSAMAKEMGESSSDVISDISKALTPLSDVNMRLSAITGTMISSEADLTRALTKVGKSVINYQALLSKTTSPISKEIMLQNAMAATGLSKSTILMTAKIQKAWEDLGDDVKAGITTLEQYNEWMERTKREMDPFAAATTDLNTQFDQLKRVLAPVTFAFIAAAEVLAYLLSFVNAFIDQLVILGTVIKDKTGLSSEQFSKLNRIFRIVVGSITLFVLAMWLIPGIFSIVGTAFKLFVGSFQFSIEGIKKAFKNLLDMFSSKSVMTNIKTFFKGIADTIGSFLTTLTESASSSIETFFDGLGKALKKLAEGIKGNVKQLLIASLILIVIAVALYIFAHAIAVVAALGDSAVQAFFILAGGLIVLGVAAAIMGYLAQSAMPGMLAIIGVILALALAAVALAFAMDIILQAIQDFIKFLVDMVVQFRGALMEVLQIMPMIGFAFLALGASLLLGALAIAAAGIILVYAGGFLIAGSISLAAGSASFGLANAGFGYAIGNFIDRAAQFYAGALMVGAGATALYKAAEMIKSANAKLSDMQKSSAAIKKAADELLIALKSITQVSSALLFSAFEYYTASAIMQFALVGLADSMIAFVSAIMLIDATASIIDSAVGKLNQSVAALANTGRQLVTDIQGFQEGVYTIANVALVLHFGSTILSIGAAIFEQGVSVLASGASRMLGSGIMIKTASEMLLSSADKLLGSTLKLLSALIPLTDASKGLRAVAFNLALATFALIPAARGMAYSAADLDKFSESALRFQQIDTSKMGSISKDITSAISGLQDISADSFSLVARSMSTGVELLERPVNKMIEVLSKLKDALVDLGLNANLDNSLGLLARDAENMAARIQNATERASQTLDTLPRTTAQAATETVSDVVMTQPLSPVTINTTEETTASQRDESAELNEKMLSVLVNILEVVGQQAAPKDLSSILGLLKEYLPDLKSSGGNLSSEFNSWG